MRRVAVVTVAVALAASVFSLANCQHYEAEPVTPRAFGTVTEPHLIEGAKPPPYVMLVVDRSGSMNDGKLSDVKDKFASASGFLAKTSARAQFGLILFSAGDQSSGGDQCQPGTITQPVGASTDQVRQSIISATAEGGTPTAASLRAVLDDPKMNTAEAGRDRYVMLLTDGAPNCNRDITLPCTFVDQCGEKTWKCCLDEDATVQQVATLASQGIRTFVIGFGNDTSAPGSQAYKVLDRAAEAGGLAQTQDRKFFQANNSDDLQKALDIFGRIIQTCNYNLAEAPREDMLQVVFVYTNEDNREEVLTPSSDWTYNSVSHQVSIIGSRCTEIEDGPSGLKVEFRYVTSL
jgi:hypothetical protein